MRLFSYILTTRAQLGTQTLPNISLAEFRSIDWLPTKERVHQCINTITFKFFNKNCSFYLNEIFEFAPHCRIDTRNSFAKLKQPFRKTNTGQKTVHWSFFVKQSTRNH